jgi:hypothetical protein
VVEKSVHTNIKQTASGQPFTFTASTLQHLPLQHLLFGDFVIVFFSLFYDAVLRVCRAASADLQQACEYRFIE